MNDRKMKYLHGQDFAISYYMKLAKSVIEETVWGNTLEDPNRVIELFIISKYIKDGYHIVSDDELIGKVKNQISINLKKIKENDLGSLYEQIDKTLYEEFWEFISIFNIYKEYDLKVFGKFLKKYNPYMKYILIQNNLVNQFDEVIREHLLISFDSPIIILEKYEGVSILQEREVYLPKSLTKNDIEQIIEKYIDRKEPNMNYLELILNLRNRDGIYISDRTRLKAKRCLEKKKEEFFQDATGFEVKMSVVFMPGLEKEKVYEGSRHESTFKYDRDWIEKNRDYSTLLNNFIYLFEFADDQMRISLVNKESEIGSIEGIFSVRAKNSYNTGQLFDFKERISSLQMYMYTDLLASLDKGIESLIKWFFEEYLKEEFQIKGYKINVPSLEMNYLEKCRIIVPEIESILKKYNLYIEDKNIDNDLLEMSSNPLSFRNCKSLLEKKYVYANIEKLKAVFYCFFSDQCMLNYIHKENKSYKTFYKLLLSRNVYIEDYDEYLQPNITFLVEAGYLNVTDENQIIINDKIGLYILADLYNNEVISYHNYSKVIQKKLDKMCEDGLLRFESSLFSLAEQQYFNYYLNKSQFGNALDLRNKYAHGTQPNSEGNNDLHRYNYITFLKLIILIIIKINDDLCCNDN